jgi:tRNA(Phe) wybutosine-synthesizing methylase Tyw3
MNIKNKKINDLTDIDPEIKELLIALNRWDCIETTCSCWGHLKFAAKVWFKIVSIEKYNNFLEMCYNDIKTNWFIRTTLENSGKKNELYLILQSILIGNEKNINDLTVALNEKYKLSGGKIIDENENKTIDFISIKNLTFKK